MADYSWVVLEIGTTDTETVEAVSALLGGGADEIGDAGEGWTSLQGETSYGLAEEAEDYLSQHDIAWRRFSDGKYEYDGDEAHWAPGMPMQRTFARLNHGGRAFSEAEYRGSITGGAVTDAELGALVREYFSFQVGGLTDD